MSYSIGKRVFAVALIMGMFFIMPQLAQSQQPGQMQQTQPIEVSDQELEKFVNVQEQLGSIQDSARQEMIAAIEDVGLDLDTYNQTVEQMQGAQSMDDIDATQSQVQKVQEASREVQKIQGSLQQEFQEVIAEEGMTPNRFQKIRQAAMQDPELQQRIRQME